jgi:hypothetical protein
MNGRILTSVGLERRREKTAKERKTVRAHALAPPPPTHVIYVLVRDHFLYDICCLLAWPSLRGCSTVFRSVGKILPDYTASNPETQYSSYTREFASEKPRVYLVHTYIKGTRRDIYSAAFRVAPPCSLVDCYQCFGKISCFHFHLYVDEQKFLFFSGVVFIFNMDITMYISRSIEECITRT